MERPTAGVWIGGGLALTSSAIFQSALVWYSETFAFQAGVHESGFPLLVTRLTVSVIGAGELGPSMAVTSVQSSTPAFLINIVVLAVPLLALLWLRGYGSRMAICASAAVVACTALAIPIGSVLLRIGITSAGPFTGRSGFLLYYVLGVVLGCGFGVLIPRKRDHIEKAVR